MMPIRKPWAGAIRRDGARDALPAAGSPPHARGGRKGSGAAGALSLWLLLGCFASHPQAAENGAAPDRPPAGKLAFNTSLLHGGGIPDLAVLLRSSGMTPGRHLVDVHVGTAFVNRMPINFRHDEARDRVEACITPAMLAQAGVDFTKYPVLQEMDSWSCVQLGELIDSASVSYDSYALRLTLSIPQIALTRKPRGYVPPSAWDEGANLAFLNYNLSSRFSRADGKTANSTSLGTRVGINLFGWRLRNESNGSRSTGQGTHFISNNTYLQHDVTDLKGQFTIGDTYSDATLFDSVRFRGVQLRSDESMRPDSEQGYAPVVRGTAETNATIEIRQNGFLLYSTNVAPGPFVIDDLASSGSNGDLEITVIEADGRRRVQRQAFGNPPLMLRQDRVMYSAEAGRYRSHASRGAEPNIFSGSLVYGLSSDLTIAGGVQLSEDYRAGALGAGWNSPLGAVSLDVTQAQSKAAADQEDSGQRLRLRYSHFLSETNTRYYLSAQSFQGGHFRSLDRHIQARDTPERRDRDPRPDYRFDASISQALGADNRYGSLYLSGNLERDRDGRESSSLSVGYSHHWRQISYSLSLTRNRNIQGASYGGRQNDETSVFLTLSIPLGRESRSPLASSSVTHNRHRGTSVLAGVSGWLPTSADISYNLQASRGEDGQQAGGASLQATTPVGTLGAGYSQGHGYRTASLGAAGSVVAHAGGVNLGQHLGDTFALASLEPPRAGVGLRSHQNVSTGYNGYAIVPFATPYRTNWVELDTDQLGSDIELENGARQVVPRRGAGVVAQFTGQQGVRVLLELRGEDGDPLSFATVLEGDGDATLGISDPRGRVLALVRPQAEGKLTLQWQGKQCQAKYVLPEKRPGERFQRIQTGCSGAVVDIPRRKPDATQTPINLSSNPQEPRS